MKKRFFVMIMVMAVLAFASLGYAERSGKMDLKVGDEVNACNCGIKCTCNTMANKEGNCTCDAPMVKAKVKRVEGETAYLEADGWGEERPFKTTGKYTCACGPTCTCNAISQDPGKCPCGNEMKKVE